MPAKTGQQYIANLRDNPAEVWMRGERVEDVTTHPALAGGVRSVAALYDKQFEAGLEETMNLTHRRRRGRRLGGRSSCRARWMTCCCGAR